MSWIDHYHPEIYYTSIGCIAAYRRESEALRFERLTTHASAHINGFNVSVVPRDLRNRVRKRMAPLDLQMEASKISPMSRGIC
jgi:hypothetical protein